MSRDLAIDLGTANTLIYVRGRGIVLDEPSAVAVDVQSGEVLAAGADAKRLMGRTAGNIRVVRPLKDGVIADFETTEQMLRSFLLRVRHRHWWSRWWGRRPRILICVPSGITSVERRAVSDTAYAAGARRVYLVDESMAAALGAGLPVREPTGHLVVDVGGGTTEVAVLSFGSTVVGRSVRIASDELDDAIVKLARKDHGLLIGASAAERIKLETGSAHPVDGETSAELRGRDLVSGLPRTVDVKSSEIRDAMQEPLGAIVDAVKSALDDCPPELSADVADHGMVLTGGGSLLAGLDARLRSETGIPVTIAERPLESVVLGAGKLLDEPPSALRPYAVGAR